MNLHAKPAAELRARCVKENTYKLSCSKDRDTFVAFSDHHETTLQDVQFVLRKVINDGNIGEEEEQWEKQFEPAERPADMPEVPEPAPVHVPAAPVTVPA